MNAAVGENCPAWMCIESIHYSTLDPTCGHIGHAKGKGPKIAVPYPTRAPDGYISIDEASTLYDRAPATIRENARNWRIPTFRIAAPRGGYKLTFDAAAFAREYAKRWSHRKDDAA